VADAIRKGFDASKCPGWCGSLGGVSAIGGGGCGSSKKSGSKSSRSTGSYHRGESCSKKKKSAYKKAHLECEKVKGGYRLK